MSITIPAGNYENFTGILENDKTTQAKYSWRVVGFRVAITSTSADLHYAPSRCCVIDDFRGQPCLYIRKGVVANAQQVFEVQIMGVLKEWSAKF